MHSRLCLWAPGAAVLITHQDHTGAKEELGFYLTTLLVNQNNTKSHKRERLPPSPVCCSGFFKSLQTPLTACGKKNEEKPAGSDEKRAAVRAAPQGSRAARR